MTRGGVVVVNKTRSQVKEIFRDKKYHSQMTSYKVCVFIGEFY